MAGQWPHPCPTRCLRGTLHDSFLMWQCNKYPNLDVWAARVDTMCIGLRSMVQVLLSASHKLLLAALAPARLLPLHLLVWLLLVVVVRLLLSKQGCYCPHRCCAVCDAAPVAAHHHPQSVVPTCPGATRVLPTMPACITRRPTIQMPSRLASQPHSQLPTAVGGA